MKKIILAALLGAILGSSAVALAAADHPNLRAAHELILQAIQRVTDAQKDNHFDMQGHAENAKKLLHQAEGELKLAVGDANKNEKKK